MPQKRDQQHVRFSTIEEFHDFDLLFGNNSRHSATKGAPSERNRRSATLNKNDTINVISPNESKSKFARQHNATLGVDGMHDNVIDCKVQSCYESFMANDDSTKQELMTLTQKSPLSVSANDNTQSLSTPNEGGTMFFIRTAQ